ncbi:hemerythrin domain-containing protein [uncultured Sulfitobacter sp.]|uniref:hemerythrin domain-containing protein n=1 Tax=uncultured Sulfitobacter sp. TaxID=191468 RepID=UPI00262CE8EE|nr:hemerythrin domain-containing protein [uncultured Sulfitobacter sp.]
MNRALNGEKLDLDLRTGLPDALRVLLDEYPRAGWEAHAGYDGLIRFWLDRHMMFRRILERMQTQTEGTLDGHIDPGLFRQQIAELGSTFVQELRGHHGIEDAHYFPVLSGKDVRIARGFALLDHDHHALDVRISAFVTRANGALYAKAAGEPAIGLLHENLLELNKTLDRHLVDEEEIVVPVILKYGAGGLA